MVKLLSLVKNSFIFIYKYFFYLYKAIISRVNNKGAYQMNGKINIFDVAKYTLKEQGHMTAMKLQKLCYYAQAWYLVWYNQQLFDEDFQAWTNGPVCKILFDTHKGKYILQSKDINDGNCSRAAFSDYQIKTIDSILKYYGNKEPQWLSTLTHMEKPWNIARVGYAEGQNCEEIITKESIKEYYGSL